jgi:O-methyltransferase involved in polyketide biosynthesis
MEQSVLSDRDFSTISPSAKWLLLMKGHTNIPFARQAAELIEYPDRYIPNFKKRDMTYWARTMHFEIRYWSIDQLLKDINTKNILELSSGYSLRGLDKIMQKDFHYIDTDLSEVIAAKAKLVSAIEKDLVTTGKLELLPLNVLDKKQFNEVVKHFSSGEIVIVNEGLLMYLDRTEKENLCRIIYDILKERQGYWIVADIYIKDPLPKTDLKIDNRLKEYYKQQNIENNKFESFEEAGLFFKNMGFTVDKAARIKPWKLSSWRYLPRSLTIRQFFGLFKAGKIHATWRLRVLNN